jgi:peptidoglycan/xylan/chitin deacetylase (PgdA/CDA1 family)
VISVSRSIKQTLESIGFYRRRLAVSPYPGVAVLVYHGIRGTDRRSSAMRFEQLHVTASRLDEHCRVLRDLDCTLIALSEWKDAARGWRPLPQRAVMLTFDDGYRSVLTDALPILERHEAPAVVFVCTGPIERHERFWYDALAEQEGEAAVAAAKTLDFHAWRARIEMSAMPAAPDDPHAPLAVDELRRLADHPLITIGAHTVSHPILRRAPLSVQAEEVGLAKATLDRWIGGCVDAFAYPNGQPGADYDDGTVDVVRRCGFEHAFTTAEGFAVPAERPLEHPRFTMLDGVTASELAHRLAVSWPRCAAAMS